MELEDYRQPWETNRHWEVKKEFLQFYKDFFPEDKLQCLAQVYSNVVLLQCSYPTKVMLQIQKFARHLNAFKTSKKDQDSTSEQMGKREILDPDSFKSKKQLKKAEKKKQEREDKEKQQREENEKQEGEEREGQETKKNEKQESEEKYKCLPDSFKSVDYRSLIQSENFSIIEKLILEVQKLSKLQKENAVDLIISAALHLNIEDLIDFKYTQYPIEEADSEQVTFYCKLLIGTTELAIGSGENRYIAKKTASENALNTLSNLPLIDKLFAEVLKLMDFNTGDDARDLLLRAAISLGIEDSLHFKFTTRIFQRRKFESLTYSREFCEIFIGAIKIAHSFGVYKEAARKKASYKALYVMSRVKNLDVGVLRPLRNKQKGLVSKSATGSKWDMELLETIAFEMKRETMKGYSVLSTVYATFSRTGRLNDLVYNTYKDGKDLFICDVLVNNVPMACGRALTKKKAKVIAAENLQNFFLNLFESKRKSSNAYVDALRLIDEHSHRTPLNMEHMFINERTREVDIVKSIVPTATFSPLDINKAKAPVTDSNLEVKDSENSFLINEKLYNNSIKQNLLLFDRSEIFDEERHTLCGDLAYAAGQCHRILSFNCQPHVDQTYMVDVLLDNKVIGSGIAATKIKAKNEAVKIVLEKLRKEIYTIKVKESSAEVLEINSTDLFNLKMNRKKLKSGGKRHFICPGNENFAQVFQHYAQLCASVSLGDIKSKIATLLKGYSKSKEFVILKFSGNFSSLERRAIHLNRCKLGLLVNKCKGKEAKNIYIKRKMKVKEILDTLIKSGGQTSKYELVDMSN